MSKKKVRLDQHILMVLLGGVVIGTLLASAYFLRQQQDNRSQAAPAPTTTKVWVQDSNGGVGGGGMLPDFKDQFTQPNKWKKARALIDVYQFHNSLFLKPDLGISDQFIKENIAPVLNQEGIDVALNVTGANWSQCRDFDQIMYREGDLVQRLRDHGLNVQYLTMQSTLSKTEGGNSVILNSCAPYPDEKRIVDITRYMSYMKQRFPGIQIGLFDADATKGNDYMQSYQDLNQALAGQGMKLDYVFLDNGVAYLSRRGNGSQLVAVSRYYQDQPGLEFGLTLTGEKGQMDENMDYYTAVTNAYSQFIANGGEADHILVTSWMPQPTHYLPDTVSTNFTLMQTVREIGRRVKRPNQQAR